MITKNAFLMNGLALGLDFTHRLKVIQHMWVINSELMQQDGRIKKTENNKICTYNNCHAVHGIRFAVFFPLPSYCASSLPINYHIEFYHPVP